MLCAMNTTAAVGLTSRRRHASSRSLRTWALARISCRQSARSARTTVTAASIPASASSTVVGAERSSSPAPPARTAVASSSESAGSIGCVAAASRGEALKRSAQAPTAMTSPSARGDGCRPIGTPFNLVTLAAPRSATVQPSPVVMSEWWRETVGCGSAMSQSAPRPMSTRSCSMTYCRTSPSGPISYRKPRAMAGRITPQERAIASWRAGSGRWPPRARGPRGGPTRPAGV